MKDRLTAALINLVVHVTLYAGAFYLLEWNAKILGAIFLCEFAHNIDKHMDSSELTNVS